MSVGTMANSVRRPREPRSMDSRMEQALRLYRTRVGRCRTENQLNRVHIALENYMTPAEARYFAAVLMPDAAASRSHAWIDRLIRFLPIAKVRPVEFARRGLCKGATRYTADDGYPGGKTLIIGFAGHFHRLMLPTAWLLDCLNPALYDLVVLRDFSRCHYALGIPGLGEDFAAALSRLRVMVDPRAYRKTIALGTSGGGLPALVAAILLELDAGIGICPSDPAHVAATLATHGIQSDAYATLLASRRDRFPELTLAYGADNPGDTTAAAAIHARVPSILRPVKRCGEHTVLAWQLERGTLPAYLWKLLGQSLESRDLIATPLIHPRDVNQVSR